MAKKRLAEPPSSEKPSPESEKKIEFHYMKGPDFRTIHCDGCIGSITPRGILHIAIFSERQAIPKKIVQKLLPNNSLGDEIPSERQTIGGIVRQMEVDVFMAEETARSLRDWLNGRLDEFEAFKKARAAAIAAPESSSKGRH